MHSHSREATGTPRLINMQSRSREATVAHSHSRSDCYPILLNMQSHSRKATGTVTPFDKYAESQKLLLNFVKYAIGYPCTCITQGFLCFQVNL